MWFWKQYSKNICAPSVSEPIGVDQTSWQTALTQNPSAIPAEAWLTTNEHRSKVAVCIRKKCFFTLLTKNALVSIYEHSAIVQCCLDWSLFFELDIK